MTNNPEGLSIHLGFGFIVVVLFVVSLVNFTQTSTGVYSCNFLNHACCKSHIGLRSWALSSDHFSESLDFFTGACGVLRFCWCFTTPGQISLIQDG